MKELSDSSLFLWEKLPEPKYWNGMQYYHRPARRDWRMRQPISGPEDSMLRIECICEVELLEKAQYMRRNAPILSLEYIRKGSLLVRQRGKMYELEEGELFLMQPALENEFKSGKSGCRKISVAVGGKLLPSFLKESGLGMVDVLLHPVRNRLDRLFCKISELTDNPSAWERGRNAALSFELLQLLRIPENATEHSPRLSDLINELEIRLDYNWKLSDMAKLCSCSPTHLVRMFHHCLHTTPGRYLLNLRMRHARRLLTDNDRTIKEIALELGFNNALNFSTSFRRCFGISPREYRKHLLPPSR